MRLAIKGMAKLRESDAEDKIKIEEDGSGVSDDQKAQADYRVCVPNPHHPTSMPLR